jgi:hypothetical protein
VVAADAGCIYPDADVRPLTRPGLVLAIAVAVFALPTIASGALSGPAAPSSNTQTYQDSTGEDPEGPDITTITVSNDDTRMLTFRINVPNRASLAQDMLFEIWVDSDDNAATGDPELAGVDYVMQLVRGEINLFKWDGTDFTRRFGDPSAVTLTQSYQAGLTVRISATELGSTKKFKFFVIALSGLVVDPVTGEIDGSNAHGDAAPGGGAGLFSYEVKVTPPTLVAKKLSASPAKPTAGKPFTLRLVAARSDTGAVIQNGRVTCVGRVGNARLRSQVARVVAGAATCTWNIPATASGKAFRGTVTVAFEGLKASQGYVSKVR